MFQIWRSLIPKESRGGDHLDMGGTQDTNEDSKGRPRGWPRYLTTIALQQAGTRRRIRYCLGKLNIEPRLAVHVNRRRLTIFRDRLNYLLDYLDYLGEILTVRYWFNKIPLPFRERIRRNIERVRLYQSHARQWQSENLIRLLPAAMLQAKDRVVYLLGRAIFYIFIFPGLLLNRRINDLDNFVGTDPHPFLAFFPHLSVSTANRLVKLAQRTGRQKVAFVTVDRRTKQMLMDGVPDAVAFSTQDFWVDSSADLRIHLLARNLLMELNAAASPSARKILDYLDQSIFVTAIRQFRLAEAVAAAVNSGADVIAIDRGTDTLGAKFCKDLASEVSGKQFAVYDLLDGGRYFIANQKWKELTPKSLLNDTRRLLELWSSLELFSPSEKTASASAPAVRKPENWTIAVASEASTIMTYWAGTENLLAAINDRAWLVTRLNDVARNARQRGHTAQIVRRPFLPRHLPDFVQCYGALADAIESELNRAGATRTPVERQVRKDVLLRLLGRAALYYASNDLATIEKLTDEFRRRGVAMVVVMPHWSGLGALAISAASRVGVAVSSFPVVSVLGNHASLVGWEKLDLIGCYGEQCVEAFSQVGIDPDRLKLVGNITLDKAFRLSREDAIKRSHRLRSFLRGSDLVILVATSAIDPHEIEWFQELCRASAAIPNVRIILRPHPSFGRAAYQHFISGSDSVRCRIFAETSIHELIVVSDVVVTDFSTTGAEAVLLGKGLMVVNCTGKRFPTNNYDEDGVAVLATRPDQIEERLRELLYNEEILQSMARNRVDFIRRYNWGNDGRAGERYLNALVDYIDQSTDKASEKMEWFNRPVSASLPVRAQSSVC